MTSTAHTLADLFGRQSITTVPVVDATGRTFHELTIASDRPLAGLNDHEVHPADVIALDPGAAPKHLYRTYCVTGSQWADDYADNVAALLRVQATGDTAGHIVTPDPFDPGEVLTYPFTDADTYAAALYRAVSDYGRATTYTYAPKGRR